MFILKGTCISLLVSTKGENSRYAGLLIPNIAEGRLSLDLSRKYDGFLPSGHPIHSSIWRRCGRVSLNQAFRFLTALQANLVLGCFELLTKTHVPPYLTSHFVQLYTLPKNHKSKCQIKLGEYVNVWCMYNKKATTDITGEHGSRDYQTARNSCTNLKILYRQIKHIFWQQWPMKHWFEILITEG